MTEPRHQNLVIFTSLWLLLSSTACQKPDSATASEVPLVALSRPKPLLLTAGPRLISNQTSQPLSVTGERFAPGLTLKLGAPLNLTVPLTVLDEHHASARLPPHLPLGNATETVVSVSLEGGEGQAQLRLIGDTSFPELTALALSSDGTRAFVASATEDRIYEIDLATDKAVPFEVRDGPSAIAVWRESPTREWLVVAHQFEPKLLLVNVEKTSEQRVLEAPSYASGLSIDSKRNVAFVAEQAGDTVVAIALVDGKQLWRTPVAANPRELALTSRGLTVGSLQTGALQVLEPTTGALRATLEPKPGTPIFGGHTEKFSKYVMNGTSPRGFAFSEKLQRLFVTSIGPNIGPNPTKMEVSMNAGVATVDLAKGFVHHVGFGAGVSEALVLDEAHGVLFASDVSLGVVRLLDVRKVAAGKTDVLQEIEIPPPEGFPHVRADADFAVKGRATLSMHSGPKAMALSADGKTLFVVNRFTGTLARLDIAKAAQGKASLIKQTPITNTLAQKTRRLGQVLYFADFGRTGMSCDACHLEGHTQGVLFEKTMPLRIYRSPTVRGSRETPPYFTPASTHSMGETMKVVGGRNRFHNANPTPEEIEALTIYGSAIATLPNPFVGADGALATTLELPDGETGHPRVGLGLFEGKAGCASCHPAPHFTTDQDLATRGRYIDVGTPRFMPLREAMQNTRFEGFGTPALVGSWDVFPMLTTGLAGLKVEADESVVVDTRFPLRVAIEKWAPTHGHADVLTPQERNDLLAYVQSL